MARQFQRRDRKTSQITKFRSGEHRALVPMRHAHPKQLRRVGHRKAYRSNFGTHGALLHFHGIAGLVFLGFGIRDTRAQLS